MTEAADFFITYSQKWHAILLPYAVSHNYQPRHNVAGTQYECQEVEITGVHLGILFLHYLNHEIE